jgi:hypothetical protein
MIAQIVAQLKAKLGPQFKAIGGAAEFDAAAKGNPAFVPAIYVLAQSEDPNAPAAADILIQRVYATVGIVLVTKNVGDAKGAGAATSMEQLRGLVKDALYGWPPDEQYEPLARGKSNLLAYRDSHLWWQDTFTTSYFDKANQ